MLSLPIAFSSSISFSSQPRFPIFKSSFNGAKIQHISTIRVPPQTASFQNPSSSVVMMAKREEEMNEIRVKTAEEINKGVVDLKGELLMLRLQKFTHIEFKVQRVPSHAPKGYIEDRRLTSNMDPYIITSMIAETTILRKP